MKHHQNTFHLFLIFVVDNYHLTTVGYGDVYPITVGGKVFTFIILMIGLGIVAIPKGIISSALSHSMDKPNESLD